MQAMNSSRRFAFSLAVLLHLMLFYALSRQHSHVMQIVSERTPLTVTLLPFLAPPTVMQKPPPPLHQESAPVSVPSRVAKDTSASRPVAQAITRPVVQPPSTPTPPETAIPATPGSISIEQAALNAVGKMDKDERGGTGHGLGLPAESGTLGARLSAAIDKHGAFKAGAIEEHVYPDGRREVKVHTLLGDYCLTYESIGDSKDGFDIMQRGAQRSVPHTCGHRFD
jgi:hypothetical protein